MELYIRIQDGQTFEHPILGDNFRDAFPNVDTNNLPSEFAKFTRISPPIIGVYEIYEGVTYEQDGIDYKDVHHVRQMTDEEKTSKQQNVKDQWSANGFASWVFDETTCEFMSPVPYPQDNNRYAWDELTFSWISQNNNQT